VEAWRTSNIVGARWRSQFADVRLLAGARDAAGSMNEGRLFEDF
jgi:hypothetical protein